MLQILNYHILNLMAIVRMPGAKPVSFKFNSRLRLSAALFLHRNNVSRETGWRTRALVRTLAVRMTGKWRGRPPPRGRSPPPRARLISPPDRRTQIQPPPRDARTRPGTRTHSLRNIMPNVCMEIGDVRKH